MMRCVRRYEGHVVQALGDGIFAVFGAPVAHEDHAQRALCAALAMQEEIRAYARTLRLERGMSLEIRVGVNTGDAVVRSITRDEKSADDAPAGHATSLAASLQGLATPGTVVVSEATRGLCEGRFRFRSLGPTRVKEVSHPVELYEVTGVGELRTRLEAAERRGLTRFVGREEELVQLSRALGLARQGQGQIVLVNGEAGLGKSRLLYEFRRSIGEGTLVLEAFAVPHERASSYLPIVELLRSYLGITPRDEEAERKEKLTAKLLELDSSFASAFPYLFPLLEISDPSTAALARMAPEIRRRRTHEALKRIFLGETLSRPVVILIEDLHWLDPETEGVLETLAEGLGGARLLLVATTRPEYDDRAFVRTYTTRLPLGPLPRKSTSEILTALLGTEPKLEPLKQLVATRSEGNPFFIEEIVRELFEKGVVVRNGSTRLAQPLENIHLPATVEGILAARIDRLPAELKELLQIGAVLGRTFTPSFAATISNHPEDELRERLSVLQRVELVYEKPAFPEPEYTFKHALTREVAYGSVLKERRKVLHESAARAIESRFADRLGEHYAELAHHYSQSGSKDKAVTYLELAGRQALVLSANAEAIGHLNQALDLVRTGPESKRRAERELELLLPLGTALMRTKGQPASEVETTFARALELCQSVRESSHLFPVLYGVFLFHLNRANLRTAREIGEQLLQLAERKEDPGLLLEARTALGMTSFYSGDLTAARTHLDEGAAFTSLNNRVACLGFAALTQWCLGHGDQARRRREESLVLARRGPDPFDLGIGLVVGGMLDMFSRKANALRERAEEAISLCTHHGFPLYLAMATALRGWAIGVADQAAEGIEEIEEGATILKSAGQGTSHLFCLALQADCHLKLGQAGKGLTAVDQALALVDETDGRFLEAELNRLKGELLARATGNQPEAEALFRRAIDIARRQGAKSPELRAATSLARLLHRQDRFDEARQALAGIYAWFTEGFDLADLREARGLLEELHQVSTAKPRTRWPETRAEAEPSFVFRREGHFWTIGREGGQVIRLRDMKGLHLLAHLLRHPGVEFPPLELVAVADTSESVLTESPSGRPGLAEAGLETTDLGDAGEVLDERAKAEYRSRLTDLREELEEARSNNDRGRTEGLREEIEALTQELSRAVGLGGRTRRAASSTERARVALTKAVRRALEAIAKHDDDLGAELRSAIRTGQRFSYRPEATPNRRNVRR